MIILASSWTRLAIWTWGMRMRSMSRCIVLLLSRRLYPIQQQAVRMAGGMMENSDIIPRRRGEGKLSPGDARDARAARAREKGELPRWGIKDWVWFLVNNIIGWVLILLAWPVGLALPGPGGLPMFLIGFALITFPGKRHLTARV